MRVNPEGQAVELGRITLRFALFVTLLLAPLPFGSVLAGSVVVLQVISCVLGTLAVWVLWVRPRPFAPQARLLAVLAATLIGIGALQMVPLPASSVSLLTDTTNSARELVHGVVGEVSTTAGPTSLSPPDTLDAVLRLVSYGLFGLVAAVAIERRRHLMQLALVLVAGGAFQALYGATEYLTGHQRIFGYVKVYYLNSATGTFINRNHFAGYLALTLPFCLGFLTHRRHEPRALRTWRERLVAVSHSRNLLALFAAFCAVAIWAGVFLSYSRGGLAAAIVASAVFTALSFRKWRQLWVLLIVLAIPATVLSWKEVKAPAERFLASREELASLNLRVPIWKSTVQALPGFLPAGSGYGTYESFAQGTKSSEIRGRLQHAHSDWLEWVVEGGLLLSAVFLVLIVGVAVKNKLKGRETPSLTYLSYPLVAALCGVLFHSLVDFPLRIPAVALSAAVVAGAIASPGVLNGPRSM